MHDATKHRSRLRRGVVGGGLLASVALAATIIPMAAASGSTARTTSPILQSGAVIHYGTVLGNSKHFSLYILTKKNTAVWCGSGECVANWPPLVVAKGTKITKGSGVKGTVGTTKRGSKEQVTYNGWPVYAFIGDSKAHQSNGEGITAFGGTWYLVKAAATTHNTTAVKSKTSSSGGGW